MCLPWSISIVMTHNLAQNAFLIYIGFSASNGGHFSVYSTTFLPFFERKFDAYLRQICLFDAYLRRSGGFMCQMTQAGVVKGTVDYRGFFRSTCHFSLLGGVQPSSHIWTAQAAF